MLLVACVGELARLQIVSGMDRRRQSASACLRLTCGRRARVTSIPLCSLVAKERVLASPTGGTHSLRHHRTLPRVLSIALVKHSFVARTHEKMLSYAA